KCGCHGSVNDRTEIVLRSTYSSTLGVSNSALGAILYVALLSCVLLHLHGLATAFVVVAVVGSAYLGYVMVVRLCAILYVALLSCVLLHLHGLATAFVVVAFVGISYLGYVMVVRLGAICPTCVTIAGLNLLILWQLLA